VTIRLTSRYPAPTRRVFEAWLDPQVAGRWLFATALHPLTHVAIDPRVGGAFHLVDRRDGEITALNGEYLEILPHKRLVFTLLDRSLSRDITRVTVIFTSLKRGCEVSLSHENVPRDRAEQIESRWTGILYGLGETLAS